MILIGEKLNSSIPSTLTILENRDEAAVIALIEKQTRAGAHFLDVNASVCTDEQDTLLWVLGLIKAHSDCGIMIDTADTKVMAQGAKAAEGRELILNSATIDERFHEVTALAKETGASLVALPISLEGQAATLEERCANIDTLVGKLRDAGIPDGRIYLDVLVETLATNGDSAKTAIGAIAHVTAHYPEIKTTCGLSNISFGLPRRALINTAFVSAAVFAGLSSAILDPASPAMQDALAAAKVVAGQDDFCMDYITYLREQEEAN